MAKTKEERAAVRKLWLLRNKKKIAAIKKKYDLKHLDDKRNSDLLRHYGITSEQYNQMFVNQHGVCAICSKPVIDKEKFHVDHEHETGKIRGLLCLNCNQGLGRFYDKISLLLSAINYLTSK